jgi:hypothetical protein
MRLAAGERVRKKCARLGRRRSQAGSGPLLPQMSQLRAGQQMRQNTPFTGILPAGERRDVLESFRRHWQAGHAQ